MYHCYCQPLFFLSHPVWGMVPNQYFLHLEIKLACLVLHLKIVVWESERAEQYTYRKNNLPEWKCLAQMCGVFPGYLSILFPSKVNQESLCCLARILSSFVPALLVSLGIWKNIGLALFAPLRFLSTPQIQQRSSSIVHGGKSASV